MTYRERRERKAERLREWAGKRESGAAAVFKQGEPYRGDHAFNTQPGHIPERARLIAREDRAHASLAVARSMDSRAANIEAATDNAIYSDDPDAIERLEKKLAGLVAERDRIKAINKAARAGKLDDGSGTIELTDKEGRDLANIARHQPYYDPLHKGYPPYHLTNLGGNITRCRQRLASLRDPRPSLPRVILLRYAGECSKCGKSLERGATAGYIKSAKTVQCYPECRSLCQHKRVAARP